MIYFVRDIQGDTVKIGFSKKPRARLSQLQIGSASTLVLEKIIEGDEAAEAELHGRFADCRLRGEWFRWSGRIAAFVGEQAGVPAHAGKRDPIKSEISRAVIELGFVSSYASQLNTGARKWPVGLAVAVWKRTGHRVGPLARASDDDHVSLGGMIDRGALRVRRAA